MRIKHHEEMRSIYKHLLFGPKEIKKPINRPDQEPTCKLIEEVMEVGICAAENEEDRLLKSNVWEGECQGSASS